MAQTAELLRKMDSTSPCPLDGPHFILTTKLPGKKKASNIYMNQVLRLWDKGFIRFPYIGPIRPHRAGLSPSLATHAPQSLAPTAQSNRTKGRAGV